MNAVKHLRSLGCTDIEFSPEDAGRSDPKFLHRILAAVIEAGATTLNIPDTTGPRTSALLCGNPDVGLRLTKLMDPRTRPGLLFAK